MLSWEAYAHADTSTDVAMLDAIILCRPLRRHSSSNGGTMYPGLHAAANPDKPAYVMAESGLVVTYGELDDEANRLARLFRSAGFQVGDHVAFCLENHSRFLAIAWGAQYAGLYYTALSSRLTTEETIYIINDCGARAFITSGYKADVAAELLDATPNVEIRLMVDRSMTGYESYEEAIAGHSSEPLADPRIAGKDMLYSSGTTGRPKGVKAPLPSDPIDAPTAVTVLGQMLLGYREDMVYLSPAPLYHAAPLRFTMSVLQMGGTAIIMEHFDPERYLEFIETFRVTHSQVVPTMFIRLLNLPTEARARFNLSSLEACVHAAAPCPVAVKEQMIDWWGPVIHEYYAGTEGNGFVYCNSADWLAHKGSVGKALLGVVHIIGVPNEDFGEEVKAVVQPVVGVGPELERELIAYCRDHLADVKCPRSIDFRDELPRHPTGKLYKRLLKDEYWQGHDSRI